MSKILPFLLGTAALLTSCGPSLYIPEGDADSGRLIFSEMGCYSCHRVVGEKFPVPVADPPVPVVLGAPTNRKTRQYLAESILAPSHQYATPPSIYFGDSPMPLGHLAYENIREDSHSRMGSYSEKLTLRQWVDLVSYLESMQKRGLNVQWQQSQAAQVLSPASGATD